MPIRADGPVRRPAAELGGGGAGDVLEFEPTGGGGVGSVPNIPAVTVPSSGDCPNHPVVALAYKVTLGPGIGGSADPCSAANGEYVMTSGAGPCLWEAFYDGGSYGPIRVEFSAQGFSNVSLSLSQVFGSGAFAIWTIPIANYNPLGTTYLNLFKNDLPCTGMPAVVTVIAAEEEKPRSYASGGGGAGDTRLFAHLGGGGVGGYAPALLSGGGSGGSGVGDGGQMPEEAEPVSENVASNIDHTLYAEGNSNNIGSTYRYAVSFAVPGDSYTLDKVTLRIRSGGSGGTTFKVEIFDNVSGWPGSVVSNGTLSGPNNPNPPADDNFEYVPTGEITLAAGTTYWIVASATGDTFNSFLWSTTTSKDQGAGVFAIGDFSAIKFHPSFPWANGNANVPRVSIDATKV